MTDEELLLAAGRRGHPRPELDRETGVGQAERSLGGGHAPLAVEGERGGQGGGEHGSWPVFACTMRAGPDTRSGFTHASTVRSPPTAVCFHCFSGRARKLPLPSNAKARPGLSARQRQPWPGTRSGTSPSGTSSVSWGSANSRRELARGLAPGWVNVTLRLSAHREERALGHVDGEGLGQFD
ncbi:hypothetical protein [Streptomyces formicae]|uniref:hypothetical protein n=1 Tax=Streptomyces formicae TaxID=1616117 RepID=UPI001F1BE889|nr:hypothetical protein [Streptomyces formicae]